jgi:hypothetical protein
MAAARQGLAGPADQGSIPQGYEWDGGRGTGAGMLEPGVALRWHKWHAATDHAQPTAVFAGLQVALYGEFDAKAALRRVLAAGGGTVAAVAPPFTAAIASGQLACAVVDPSKVRESILPPPTRPTVQRVHLVGSSRTKQTTLVLAERRGDTQRTFYEDTLSVWRCPHAQSSPASRVPRGVIPAAAPLHVQQSQWRVGLGTTGRQGKTNRWVRALVAAGVPCVHPDLFVDWLARPSVDFKSHLLHGISLGPRLTAALARSRVTRA